MLNNYERLPNGVIKQVDIEEFKYDVNYANTYNSPGYAEKGILMAKLRLNYLVNTLGFIPNSILDVGYGNGDFLNEAKTIVGNCFGNDISGYPCPEGVMFVNDIFKNHFDVITFFDVLEHFKDPTVIKDLDCDYVYISLPNCEYQSDEWFEQWKHRKPNEHLWHFNIGSLNEFMQECGFTYVSHSFVEDDIRKNPAQSFPNILSTIFKKNKK